MLPKQSQERIVLSAPAHLPGVQALIADNCGPRCWRAYHETFTTCVGLQAKKSSEWTYRGKTHVQGVGGLMLMEPGEIHSNTKDVSSISFRVLMISPDTMKQAVAELGGWAREIHFNVAQTYDQQLFSEFRDLHFSIENNTSALEQQSRFVTCLQLLAGNCIEFPLRKRAPQVHSSAVRKAKDCVWESFNQNISLDELAHFAGMNKYHLVRSFKREVGLTPHAYQIQLQLSAARQRLRKGFPIADAAAHGGFSDQSHFTRHFKRFWGTTPKAFAESARRKPVFFPKQFVVR